MDLESFAESGADVPPDGVVSGQALVGALEDDDIFFPRSASITAASGKGRITLRWIEPTFALRCSRR